MFIFNVDKYTLPASVYQNRLLHLHLSRLKTFGLIIFADQKCRFLHCFRGICLTVCFAAFNVTQFIDLLSKWGNVEEMTNNAATTLLFFTMVFRLISFYMNWTNFCQSIKQIDDDTTSMWKEQTTGEIDILEKHVNYSIHLTIVFWTLTILTGSSMCVNSIIQWFLLDSSTNIYIKAAEPFNFTTPEPPLILQTWFPVDNKWKYFYLIYFVQCFNMAIGILIVPCWHSFMVAIMMYPIIVMEQISYKLKHTQDYINRILATPEFQQNQRNLENDGGILKNNPDTEDSIRIAILVNCIQRHLRVSKFVDNFKKLTSDSIFLDFVIFSILICALLFQASKTSIGVQFTINIAYIMSMIAILAMYYWHANEIFLYSDQISASLYKSNWYNGSANYKKLATIFLTITVKPIILKAVFIDITLNTFLNILRASYSYFTLLKQME